VTWAYRLRAKRITTPATPQMGCGWFVVRPVSVRSAAPDCGEGQRGCTEAERYAGGQQ
jgi:hypothetical protein